MNSFWKGKKVLITGVNGFIGGNLAKKLNTLGAEIFGPAARASKASWVRSPNSARKVVVKESRITISAPLLPIESGESSIDSCSAPAGLVWLWHS